MKNSRGVFYFWILILVLIFAGIGGYWFFYRPAKITTIDKTDPQWLRKYCFAQIAKLPNPPFAFQKESPVGGTLTDYYIRQRLDPNKKREACTVWYSFDKARAYTSLGVPYVVDIKAIHQFEEKVENILVGKIDPSWAKISPLESKESGNPGYGYQGFPLVFKRSNPSAGTTEFADFSFGVDFYVKLTVEVN